MIIKNYLYSLAYQIITILLPIVTIPYISRILGADGLGVYALTNTYAQYFILFGMLGLAGYSSREIAYVRDNSEKLSTTFWEINFLRFITMGIAIILYFLIFGIVIKSSDKIVYIIQGFILLASLFDISWLFIGLEDFKKVVMRDTCIKLIGIVLVFMLVKNSNQVWLYTLLLGVTQLVGQIIMWLQIPKNVKFVIPKFKGVIMHLSLSMALFVPQIAGTIYTMLDKIMLGILTNDAQVGMYDNSQKIIKVLTTVVTALSVVTIPRMANLYKNHKYEEFNENVYKSFSFVSFLAIPMTFGLAAITKFFTPWFYGPGFEQIIPMFQIGSFLIITLGWSSIIGSQVLICIQREKQLTMSISIGAILNIIINFLLIQKYQGLGTTIASVIAEYSGMFLMTYFLRDILNVKLLFKPVLKYLISSLMMFFIIYRIGLNMNSTIIGTIILFIVGLIGYLIIMIVTKDENLLYGYSFIKGVIKSKTNKKSFFK